MKSMDTKDIMARTLLYQEAFEKIYTPAVQTLMKGNPDVQEAARDSALVNARVAQAFHEAYGEPYENIAKIVMGEDVETNGFNMAASERNKTISHNKNISKLRDFPNEINELFKDTPERAKFTSTLSGVRYPGERVKHVEGKHGITGSDLEDIDTHIDVLYDPAITAHKNKNGNLYGGQYQGTHIITRIHGDRGDYRVVLTFMPNGNVIFESAFKGDAQAIKNDITTHSSKVLQPNGKALPPGSTVVMSIPMIKKELGIVNQTYNQLAGEKALTADRLKLQQAQAMESEGKTPEEIWDATGWMKGKDEKWHFEIPDVLEDIHFDRAEEGKQTTIGAIYDNPKLYEAYPFLRDVPFRIENLGEHVRGATNGDTIIINKTMMEKDPVQSKSTLLLTSCSKRLQ